MHLDFLEGEEYETKATVTVRADESLSSSRKKDLRAGTLVTLLEFGRGSEQRARISTEAVDGWISLETKQGRPFLGKVVGRTYPAPDLARRPLTSVRRPQPAPLAGWETLQKADSLQGRQPAPPTPPPVGVRRAVAPPAPVAAAESAEAAALDVLLELSEDDLVDSGVFNRQEAHEFAGLPEDEKRRIVELLKQELAEGERPPVREITLTEMKRGLALALYGEGVPEGEMSYVPGLAD